jgi:hypothetical protein
MSSHHWPRLPYSFVFRLEYWCSSFLRSASTYLPHYTVSNTNVGNLNQKKWHSPKEILQHLTGSKEKIHKYLKILGIRGWSQWPRGLRRRSSAARLLRLWVLIPPWSWMFVCRECCVLSGRGLCDELITRPEESYWMWRVIECDQETSKMRRLKPATVLWKYNHNGL